MKHEKEWHTCDRCGAEIKIPKKTWCDFSFPLTRRIQFDKPVKLSTQIYEIKKMMGRLETKLDPIDSFEFVEYYDKKTKDFDLCPKCRKDFERFMKNEKITK